MEVAHSLSKRLGDYIDCIVIATAAANKEELVTEDSKIMKNRGHIKETYGITVTNYKELLSA